MRFDIAIKSDMGLVRKNNEDNFFAPNIPVKKISEPYSNENVIFNDKQAFICVCDGMGGHNSGEVAAYMVANQLEENYNQIKHMINKKKDVQNVCSQFISNINDLIYDTAEQKAELKCMGTTFVGLYFFKDYAFFVNVGDSRAYVMNGNKLVQLTEDHADSNNSHALTRFMGMSTEYSKVYPDVPKKGVSVGLKKRFILCSDGLTDMVDDAKIQDILISEKKPESAADKLVDQAKKNGGKDNITVAVIDVKCGNTIKALVKNKIAISVFSFILLAGVGIGYYFMDKPTSSGISLDDINVNIEMTENISEVNQEIEAYLKEVEKNKEYYENYSNTVDECNNAVKNENENLKGIIDNLSTDIEYARTEFEKLKNDKLLTNERKLEKLKILVTDNSYTKINDEIKTCEECIRTLNAYIDNWKEEIERKKIEETQKQRSNNKINSSESSSYSRERGSHSNVGGSYNEGRSSYGGDENESNSYDSGYSSYSSGGTNNNYSEKDVGGSNVEDER